MSRNPAYDKIANPRVRGMHKNDAPQPPAMPHPTDTPAPTATQQRRGMANGVHSGSAAHHFRSAVRSNGGSV
jgi:hypothetical protein